MIKVITSKEGPYLVTRIWEVDETKPRVSVVGHFYEFNTNLLSSIQEPLKETK